MFSSEQASLMVSSEQASLMFSFENLVKSDQIKIFSKTPNTKDSCIFCNVS